MGEKKTRNVEEWLMDSSPKQRTSIQRPVCQEVFDEAQDHRVGTSTVFT
jgi:hypothetical protein